MIELTTRQSKRSVEGMGKHSAKKAGHNPVTNPTGLDKEGAGPIQDTHTRQAVIDSWNIDAAYDKHNPPKGENGGRA